MTTPHQTRIACLLFVWSVGGIATLIGLGGVFLTSWYTYQGRLSESWPEVVGLITHSRIGSSNSAGGAPGSDRITSKSDKDYSVKLRYTYQVAGQTFESTRLRFGSTKHDRRSDAEEEQRQFPARKKVAVYYNPEKPGRSVLVRGTGGNWGQLIGLSICMLFGIALLMLAIRSTLKKPEEGGKL